jgi:hypothetical protein
MFGLAIVCEAQFMNRVLIYVPVVLSLVMLGAHFMRFGNTIGVVGSVVLIVLLIVRRPWVARLIQIVLVIGTLEWIRTLYELVQLRVAHGQPFTRMLIILSVVAAVTFCSALLFQLPTMKRVYRLNHSE